MNRREKFKQWVKTHEDGLALMGVVGLAGLAVAGFVAIIKADNRSMELATIAHNEWADDMNAWLDEERAKGNVVYPLDDGRYLTVAEDATQETVER